MKHLEDTINQYHLQSEKNLEGNKCGFKNTRSVVFRIQCYSSNDQSLFFLTAVLRQRAEEVANLEKELRELQITAGRLVEKRNQNQNHFEQTEGRLQKQQEGKYQLVSCVGLY